jgi:hypothetical protein
MFEGLEKIKADIMAAREAAKTGTQAALKEAFKEVFAAHPGLKAVKWTQYTPYFNDGDACVFGVHDWYARVGGQETGGDDDDGFLGSYELRESAAKGAADHLSQLFKALDDDAMQAAFGDHCEVVATRDGFAVEKYEHH